MWCSDTVAVAQWSGSEGGQTRAEKEEAAPTPTTRAERNKGEAEMSGGTKEPIRMENEPKTDRGKDSDRGSVQLCAQASATVGKLVSAWRK